MEQQELILSQSEYAQLLEEIRQLQARIAGLTVVRDDLVYHVCPALKAEYEEKILSLQRELIAVSMYLQEKRRIIELLQAQLNRRQALSFAEAEKIAREEFQEKQEELKKKAEEARKFRERWKKETQWSAHDQKEKEAREKAAQEKAAREKAAGKDAETKAGKKDPNEDTAQEDSANRDGDAGKRGSHGKGDADHSEGTGQGDAGRSGTGNPGEDDAPKDETPLQKMKRLYRNIVKRLHPDANPNATQREKDLLIRATQAYKRGDLNEIEQIWEELTGLDAPEDLYEDTPEGRKKLRELLAKLKTRCRQLEKEIEEIRNSYPYRYKAFLENEKAVEEMQGVLRAKIAEAKEMDRKLAEYIEKLKEKLGKEQPA